MILTYNKLVNPGLLASQIRANVTSLAGGNFGVTQSPQSPTEQMLYISVPDTLSAADQQAVGTVVANHVAAQSDPTTVAIQQAITSLKAAASAGLLTVAQVQTALQNLITILGL